MPASRPTNMSDVGRGRRRWCAAAIFFCLMAAALADGGPTYYIQLVASKTQREVVAIVREARPGGSEHTSATVEALEQYLATLQPGSSVTWHCPPDPPPGYEKFAAEWPEVQKFCAGKKVDFMFSFSAR